MPVTLERLRFAIAVVVIFGLSHCTSSKPPASSFHRRDSVGIEIVEYGDSLPSNLERWYLDSKPALDLGIDGRDQAELFRQIHHIVRLESGSLVIVDQIHGGGEEGNARGAVKIFDSLGKFVRTLAGFGDGPGEVRWVSWIHVGRGDSIWLYDSTRRRLSVFDSSGRLAREASFGDHPEIGNLSVRGQFATGALLLETPNGRGATGSGFSRRSTLLRRLSTERMAVDTIGTYPGMEIVSQVSGSGGSISGIIALLPPFGRYLSLAVSDSTLFLGTQERYDILELTPEGKVARIIRRLVGPSLVTAELRRKNEERLTKLHAKIPANARQPMSTYPDRLPAHGRFIVDAGSRLWVEDYDPDPDPTEPTRWLVYQANGQMVARAETPRNIEIKQIDQDLVVAMVIDSNDVNHAVIYRLHRSPVRASSR